LDTITYDVNSSSGEKWYTYITKKNGNTVYDHKTKKYYEGHSIPIQNFKKRETYRPHYGDIYTQLGWEKRGTKIFNGLNVLIFNLSKPVKDQQEPLPSGQYETPVTYDFSPVIREYETLIDSVSGVVIAYSVFGVDTYGNKILLRSFSLDRLERVKS